MRIFILLFTFLTFCLSDMSFPALTDRVVDNANILTDDTKITLKSILQEYENSTANQVVVATVKSLQGYEIEEYSVALARHWALGQKEKNNGVLLLVAPNERKVRVEVGYGLEDILTDKVSHEIIQYTILPEFKKENFNIGVLRGIKDIVDTLNSEDIADKQERKKDNFALALLLIFSLVLGYVLYLLGAIFGSNRFKRVGMSIYISFFLFALVLKYVALSFLPFVLNLVLFVGSVVIIFRYLTDDDFKDYESSTTLIGSKGFSIGALVSIFSGGGGGSFGGGGASGSW